MRKYVSLLAGVLWVTSIAIAQQNPQEISFSSTSISNPMDKDGSKDISNALEFDGVDDFVSIPQGTALLANLSEFSMCAWVYPTNPNANWPDLDGYFGIKNEGICDFYVAQINGTGLEARIRTNTGIYTIDPPMLSPVAINVWQHFALVYTGSELQLYLNGELDGSVPADGLITYDNFDLTFGKLVFQSNDFYLPGKLDEITIWSKALTADEVEEYQCITEDPSSISDLSAYYSFNEEEGSILPDYFGNYDGILTNMIGDEWVSSEVCESGYTIQFIVTDEESGSPVENAEVNLEGLIKLTNDLGIAEFTNYDPGSYPWSINKTDYYESIGSAEVVDEDITVEVELAPILLYSITFIVTEDPGGNPIDSAIVNLDGILQFTNELGETTFTGYLPNTYSYVVIKEGYPVETGTAEVIDDDLIVDISLLLSAIQQNVLFGVDIFPNPSFETFNINFIEEPSSSYELVLSDLSGRNVKTQKLTKQNNQINLSGLKKGMYLLQITFQDKFITTKILKK